MTADQQQSLGNIRLRRPNRLILAGLKAPKLLYNLGLGMLFGHRFLLLTHQGRKSGLVYQTPLEVVRFDPITRTSIVISAWGESSDWYRNIRDKGALQIQTGRDRYVPEQRLLSADESERELELYRQKHGPSAKVLSFIFGVDLTGDSAQRRAFAEAARMVAFSPRSARQP